MMHYGELANIFLRRFWGFDVFSPYFFICEVGRMHSFVKKKNDRSAKRRSAFGEFDFFYNALTGKGGGIHDSKVVR